MSHLLIFTLIFTCVSYSMDFDNVLEDECHKLFGDNWERDFFVDLSQSLLEAHKPMIKELYRHQCPWCSYWTLSERSLLLELHMNSCCKRTSNEEENKKICKNIVAECQRQIWTFPYDMHPLDCMRKFIEQEKFNFEDSLSKKNTVGLENPVEASNEPAKENNRYKLTIQNARRRLRQEHKKYMDVHGVIRALLLTPVVILSGI